MNRFLIFLSAFLLILLSACRDEESKSLEVVELEVEFDDQFKEYPVNLSEYGFFEGPLKLLQASETVYPYSLNIPLFTDYAFKERFFFLPDSSKIEYREESVIGFPKGSVLIKNFYYPLDFRNPEGERKIIETRLLIHEDDGWKALPYIWNEDQSEAVLSIAGGVQQVEWLHYDQSLKQIEYSIPNVNQCKSCHVKDGEFSPIGPSAMQLNEYDEFGYSESNQLLAFQEQMLIESMPAYDEIPYLPNWNNHDEAFLDERARGYLDINCAHCHNPLGPAKTSGLDLRVAAEGYALGIKKRPVAAGKGSGGHQFDIDPAHPESSILLYRMTSTDPGEMMPELGRGLVHEEGVKLIHEWIQNMEASADL